MLRSSLLHIARTVAVAVVLLQCSPARPAAARETLSPAEATRMGMVSAWQRQMSIAGGLQGLADAQIYVDTTRMREIVEITAGEEVLMRIPGDRVDQSGQPIGIDEAERLARLEIYKLGRRGIQATQARREIPQVRLYVLGNDGTVEARDAESGRILWTQQHGDPRLPSLPMAINEQYVMFANGMDLIVLDAMTGHQSFTRRYRYVPVSGPTIVGEYVMTLGVGRRVEGFPLKDLEADLFTAVAAGPPTTGGVAAPGVPRMMWPTESEYVYALDASGRPGMAFRFRADGLVTAPPAVGPGGRFFMATNKGQVYGISALGSGQVLWRQSLGDPIYNATALYGDRLYVHTIDGEVYCLDATDGQPVWPSPATEVERILGGTGGQLIVRTTTARLKTLDAETGSALHEFAATNVVDSIHNPLTDRLYLLTSTGGIQCLRPVAAEVPTMLREQFELPEAAATEEEAESQPQEAAPPANNNPFNLDAGDGEMPGGGGADDPFGGGGADDPFGGGGMDDIFGGGEDPFGN